MNHVFEIDGMHWYSAESTEEALSLFKKDSGDEPLDDPDVQQVPDDKPISVIDPDAPEKPKTIKPACEWAAEGKGLVATTEY